MPVFVTRLVGFMSGARLSYLQMRFVLRNQIALGYAFACQALRLANVRHTLFSPEGGPPSTFADYGSKGEVSFRM